MKTSHIEQTFGMSMGQIPEVPHSHICIAALTHTVPGQSQWKHCGFILKHLDCGRGCVSLWVNGSSESVSHVELILVELSLQVSYQRVNALL